MKYYINRRRVEPVNDPLRGRDEWYVTDNIGRWVHSEGFNTEEKAQKFLAGFLLLLQEIEQGSE
jgi:hypothetical protein